MPRWKGLVRQPNGVNLPSGRGILYPTVQDNKRMSAIHKPKGLRPTDIHLASISSGYQDSNLGPPAPKAGALTGLRYIPSIISLTN